MDDTGQADEGRPSAPCCALAGSGGAAGAHEASGDEARQLPIPRPAPRLAAVSLGNAHVAETNEANGRERAFGQIRAPLLGRCRGSGDYAAWLPRDLSNVGWRPDQFRS